MTFFQSISGLSPDWASKRIATIETYGDAGFELLKEMNIDYSTMGPEAFEMLSKCVENASAESIEKLKSVLRTSDISWVNRFLKRRIDNRSFDEIAVEIEKLYKKSGSVEVAVNGKKMFVKNLLDGLSRHTVDFYYKINGDANYIGIMLKDGINVFVELGINGIQETIKAYPENKLKDVMKSWATVKDEE